MYAVPRFFWGPAVQDHFFSFALFIGMNLANSANPVIARILLELNLLNRPIGVLIMSATVVDDLVNWTIFAVILNDITPTTSTATSNVTASMALIAILFVGLLGVGRRVGPILLERMQPHVTWPSGVIAIISVMVLLASSASEALGVHGFLGAFLIGVALGDARHRHAEAHAIIGGFVLSLSPIYFISMGMTTNFIADFDPLLVGLIVVAACVTKIASVLLGAAIAGMALDRETWAIAFGLNARGATGIILANVGLTMGVIDSRIFVAMVVTALLTSLMAGPAMNRLVGGEVAMNAPMRAPQETRTAQSG